MKRKKWLWTCSLELTAIWHGYIRIAKVQGDAENYNEKDNSTSSLRHYTKKKILWWFYGREGKRLAHTDLCL